jgi:hypothetical protein
MIPLYILQVTSPSSNIASYCNDSKCDKVIVPNDNGYSIGLCQNDASTIINPSSRLYTYDLMTSTTPGCYPIVGTVEIR